MWRCTNDMWGYCSGEPELSEGYVTYGLGNVPIGGFCKLDLKTCGKFQTLAEQLREIGRAHV